MDDNETLSNYGLGTIFKSWQLKLIQKGNPSSTGNYNVEFLLPGIRSSFSISPFFYNYSLFIHVFQLYIYIIGTPEWFGMSKKTLKVDAYQNVRDLLISLCNKLKVLDSFDK